MVEEIVFHRILRPNRSMSLDGQQGVLYVLLGLLLILAPAIAVQGLWFLLLILLSPVALMVMAFVYHNRNMRLYEELLITRDRLELQHVKPNGQVLEFISDPHWVKVEILEEGGPVDEYLTLRDQHRHVELGRFLSPEQRRELYRELLIVKGKF